MRPGTPLPLLYTVGLEGRRRQLPPTLTALEWPPSSERGFPPPPANAFWAPLPLPLAGPLRLPVPHFLPPGVYPSQPGSFQFLSESLKLILVSALAVLNDGHILPDKTPRR